VLRVTPASYYADVLATGLRNGSPYASLPNFAAADAAAVLGVGRTEYIATSNAVAAASRGPFRASKAAVRDLLPRAPKAGAPPPPPWWRAHSVNMGDTEFKALTPGELAAARAAAAPGGARAGDLEPGALAALHVRGLVYLSVPLSPDDGVTITSLEGFVSNRDGASAGGRPASGRGAAAPPGPFTPSRGDPLEDTLYTILLAAGPSTSVARLATLLGADEARVLAAVGVAARLGFARISPAGERGVRGNGDSESAPALDGACPPPPASLAVALVVDAGVASLLMVGALSPGLKRHAVTLFEGGRLAGREAVRDLLSELDASAVAAAALDGDAASLGDAAKALATALHCVAAGAGEGGVEVVRKESLAGLAPAAALRVLRHAYRAAVSVAPSPPPPLALPPPGGEGWLPHHGPSAAGATAWARAALFEACGAAPPGATILPTGLLLRKLPPALRGAGGALVWAWGDDAGPRGLPRPPAAHGAGVAAAPFVLAALNEALARDALLVVPLEEGGGGGRGETPALVAADVPLPLPDPLPPTLAAFDAESGAPVAVPTPAGLGDASASLGLATAVGALRFARLGASWTPLGLTLGLSLAPPATAAAVAAAAGGAEFLSEAALAAHAVGAAAAEATLARLIATHGGVSDGAGGVPPPARVLVWRDGGGRGRGRFERAASAGWLAAPVAVGEVE